MSEAPVTENKKRFREIDVLYALGALLVILGHSHPNDWSTFPGEWVRFIYYFHMPLFFFIDSAPDAGSLLCPSSSLASLPGKLQDAYEWKVYSLFESVSGKTHGKQH